MKVQAIFGFAFFVLTMCLFSEENIFLKNGEDYLEKLLTREVFLKHVKDVDYTNGSLFFLDDFFSQVLRIDFESGKLIKTYFRKGQGPKELISPVKLTVKNNKIFVLDKGFNGIKIVDLDGNLVNEFKVKGNVGRRNIAVNDKDEIFIGEYDAREKSYISVYNLKGKRIRTLGMLSSNADNKIQLEQYFYTIRLDKQGNIYLLFNLLRELKKLNSKGELIWEKQIKNSILNKFQSKDKVKRGNGTIRMRFCIFDFRVTQNNNILVGHCGGGCLFDSSGVMKRLIFVGENHNLSLFKLFDTKRFYSSWKLPKSI